MPPGGLNIRWPDPPLDQEYRLHRYKLYAALAFARANRLDRIVIDSPRPRFGIVTTGKSYLDVRQALDDLGIDDAHAAEIGLRLYKVAMPWPLEREGVRHFAEGLEEMLVVEEKRAVIENQFKEQLYNWREDVRPRVIGKFDESRNWILPSNGELTPAQIARVIAAAHCPLSHLAAASPSASPFSKPRSASSAAMSCRSRARPISAPAARTTPRPGCPEGSRALAGIGCHYLAQFMDRSTATFTQMGGEGAPWIGQAPFTETPHVFANLGDGTYTHSGVLAIRAAVAAKVNMTYKLLFNDAVAMTGGQPIDGGLTVPVLTRQLAAEGVRPIVVVTDEPDKYPPGAEFPAGHDGAPPRRTRRGAARVARDRRASPRSSTTRPAPPRSAAAASAAASPIRPSASLSTIWSARAAAIARPPRTACRWCRSRPSSAASGRSTSRAATRIIPASRASARALSPCMAALSRSAQRGRPRRGRTAAAARAGCCRTSTEPYGILVTGVGGTGVVTIGALLGMAAHLEGKGCTVLDMTRHGAERAAPS